VIIPPTDANVIPPTNTAPKKSRGICAKLRTFVKKPKGKGQQGRKKQPKDEADTKNSQEPKGKGQQGRKKKPKDEADTKNSQEPEVGDFI
jgi:hypothetical protein